jgi:hypothetical protein
MTEHTKYSFFCELWIASQTSTLEDCLDVLFGELPNSLNIKGTNSNNSMSEQERVFIEMLVRNNLGGAIKHYPPTPGESKKIIRINPIEFLEWVESLNNFPIPEILVQSKNEFLEKRATRRKPSSNNQDQYRTQALAEYFWSIEPDLTKSQMAEKEELLKFGPINSHYQKSTIENWIKESNPNRNPGRRKQDKG